MKSITLSLFSFLVLSSFQVAHACSCQEWGSAAETLERADAAFLGIPATKTEHPPGVRWTNAKTEFTIVRNFKGAGSKKLEVLSPWLGEGGGANCGAGWEKDEGQYLILAYEEGGKWHTSSCSYSLAEGPEMAKFIRELAELAD